MGVCVYVRVGKNMHWAGYCEVLEHSLDRADPGCVLTSQPSSHHVLCVILWFQVLLCASTDAWCRNATQIASCSNSGTAQVFFFFF